MLAYIKNGIIVGLHDDYQDVDPAAYGEGVRIVPVQGTAKVRDPEPAATKPNLKAYAANKRWRLVTGGFTSGGVIFATDAQSQASLQGAYLLAQDNPSLTVNWKGKDGTFHELNKAAIDTATTAIGTFIQDCFTTEAEAIAGIDSNTLTTYDQVDTFFSA